jgi:glycosyltransferase involved in cell wall biosynthesis
MRANRNIAASFGEGFGLPLIEAARHKLPILAREIPVFREVASNHASYFKGTEPEALASSIRNWLALYAQDAHPKSDHIRWCTWAENAEQLRGILGLSAGAGTLGLETRAP